MSAVVAGAAAHVRTDEFDYPLPRERIAQEPLAERDGSRLLHLAAGGTLDDRWFTDLPDLLQPGDLLVANDARVRNARLRGELDDGSSVELLVLERTVDGAHLCLARPARRVAAGTRVAVSDRLVATCDRVSSDHAGARVMRFAADTGDVERAIDDHGAAPVPPYVRRLPSDRGRYQTVYARGAPEAAAAPTAGLHFTESVLEALRRRDVAWTTVRLDIGLATFAPIREEHIDAHRMHEERYELTPDSARAVAAARARGGRVIAVGTTVVRVLETCAAGDGTVHPRSGRTRLYLAPGHEFRAVDGLLTNFHQPRSSLLVLLAAFTGGERWRVAYAHALQRRYRFLSFGDCMLCWRGRA